jgi:RNA polymerase sigma-70 factor (ECF subfamily)
MAAESGLGATFLAHLEGGPGDRALPENLDAALVRLWDTARAAWPGLVVDAPRFVRHLAERVPPGADLVKTVAEVHAADLYLACACTHEVVGALRRFDEHHAESVSRALRRVDPSAAFADDVRQQVRQKLFMSEDGAAPRIAAYSGRGPLASWLGVIAHRAALNLVRSQNAHARASEGAETLLASGNPELDVLRQRGQTELREAFQAAIAELSAHERMILLLCFVKGLSHEKIALFYNVHQTTITRQVGAARRALQEKIATYYRERLKLSASELDAVTHLMGSQLDLSLARWLGEEPE